MKRTLCMLLALLLILPGLGAARGKGAYSARTPLTGTSAKTENIRLAAARIDGSYVPYGGTFSFNETVGPRTQALGYVEAENGRGARVTGGGVAQAATTLYLALQQIGDGILFDSLSTYGSRYADSYVESGDQAVLVDYAAGTDFAFTNYGDDMTISMYLTDSYLYCTITCGGQEAEAEVFFTPENASQAPAALAESAFAVSGTEALLSNITLAADSINDTVLLPDDVFSFNAIVGPRTEKNGYREAVNGRGAEVVGGGVAQVASVIWLAIRDLDCVAVIEKSTYGSRYNQSYVSLSNDAILTDYNSGQDFSFRNSGSATLTIRTRVEEGRLICEIYEN